VNDWQPTSVQGPILVRGRLLRLYEGRQQRKVLFARLGCLMPNVHRTNELALRPSFNFASLVRAVRSPTSKYHRAHYHLSEQVVGWRTTWDRNPGPERSES